MHLLYNSTLGLHCQVLSMCTLKAKLVRQARRQQEVALMQDSQKKNNQDPANERKSECASCSAPTLAERSNMKQIIYPGAALK